MTIRSRTLRARSAVRALAVIALAAALGLVAVVTARQVAPTGRSPEIEPVDGWTLKDVRSARYQDGSRILSLTADEVALRHARLGMFGIGFARRLEARNARVDVELRAAGTDRTERLDIRAMLEAIGGANAPKDTLITGARVDGLILRVHVASGEWLEIAAGRCEASALDRGHVVFRDDVRVRSASGEVAFATLDYDPRARRFVDGRRADRAMQADLEVVNDALLRLIDGG